MIVFTSRAALILSRIAIVQSCRRIQPKQTFRTTSILEASSADPVDPAEHFINPVSSSSTISQTDKELSESSEVIDDEDLSGERARGIERVTDCAENETENRKKLKDKSTYGSAVKRSRRNARKVEELPRFEIPNWFLEKNVIIHEDVSENAGGRSLAHYNQQQTRIASSARQNPSLESLSDPKPPPEALLQRRGLVSITAASPPPGLESSDDSYVIDEDILHEIQTMVVAGLRLPSINYADSYAASKPHLLLQSPKDGGIFFLDAVVKHVAANRSADIIRIDAQDISTIAEEFGGDLTNTPSRSLSSLGYDTHLMMSRNDYQSHDEDLDEEDEYDDGEEAAHHHPRSKQSSYSSQTRATILPLVTILAKGTDFLSSGTIDGATLSKGSSHLANAFAQKPSSLSSKNSGVDKAKIFSVLEAFLDAAYVKRKMKSYSSVDDVTEDINQDISNQQNSTENTIVLVRDYAEMNATLSGGALLSKLHEVVTRRRKDGQRILIVGTTSSEDLVPSLSISGFKALQTGSAQPYRTIVTPCRTPSVDDMFAKDMQERTREINIRHLQEMIRRLMPNVKQAEKVISQADLFLHPSLSLTLGLEESVWSFEGVHRAALMVLGTVAEGEEMTSHNITRGLTMLNVSDNAKADWIVRTKKYEQKHNVPMPTGDSSSEAKKELDSRTRKIQNNCNSYEKKLLNGVVDAANIHTTFSDIQAPTDTIEALKTLTMLSLLRPDAFTYGVLASDSIPGLLLYGPPGTGKTLLAKAVAKESGATVLEVSGADILSMYVGESEKHVKAIFSLAKKLASYGGCVIFIDEADALFGSRSSSSNRTSHREIINQFLREWDGMNNLSAFVMVATNRPFDLDDAVLRRLPRRLLVDLPTERDREAILRIHLKNEVLDPSVSLSHLASRTPFYSGSDLKNLSVAAALACVREENDSAAGHTRSEPCEYPKQRTLSKRHFDKAMEEISASISEDMSSLSAIRKFDEKYGDRRGRRKKSSGYGFGTLTELEKSNTDAIRIRA